MKKLFILLTVFAAMFFMLSCGGSESKNDDETTNQDELGGGNSDGNYGSDNNHGSGDNPGGQTLVGADIFKAFDKVGNQFWYQQHISGSYVSYKRGVKHYQNEGCINLEVVAVDGNTATVNEYRNFAFDKPETITFSRGADGSLSMNGKQVTNTQSPVFYIGNPSKKGRYEWKESYNNGEYTNIFYTKSNGYTSTDYTYDISERWNAYGLAGSKRSFFNNKEAGSDTTTITLKSAETAYVSTDNNLEVSGVTLTNLFNKTDDPKDYYIQENPTAVKFMVTFTHNTTNTWGYGIGVYLNGSQGDAFYPFYSIEGIHDYIKVANEYNNATDDLGKGITDSDAKEQYYTFYMTPKLVELCKSWGQISFSIFALGFGQISTIEDEKAVFTIDCTEEETPATRRITNRSALKPLPLRLNNRIPAR